MREWRCECYPVGRELCKWERSYRAVQYSDPHWSWFLRTCTTCPSWPRTLRLSCSLSAVSSPIVFWKGLTSLRLGFKTDYLVNPIILQKGLLFYFNWNILEKLCYKMANRFYYFRLTKKYFQILVQKLDIRCKNQKQPFLLVNLKADSSRCI